MRNCEAVDSTVDVVTITEHKVVGAEVNDINFAFDQVEIDADDHDNLDKVGAFPAGESQGLSGPGRFCGQGRGSGVQPEALAHARP